MSTKSLRIIALAIAGLAVVGCSSSDTVTLQGCGATLPAPLYKRWFLEFYKDHPDVRVNYQAIGSGAGMRQLEEGLVNFGATDAAQSENDLKKMAKTLSDREGKPVELVQVPMTAGSVAICYNVPGVEKLKLTRSAYVGIFLCKITYWNDPQIQESNPGVELPEIRINVVHRAEGSGTTFVFTNHLNAIDPLWKKENDGPGAGKTIKWSSETIGGKGNSGVAALIQLTPGAIGYVEAGYAELTDLPIATLQNQHGRFVEPTDENCRIALQEAKFNKVFGAAIPDPKGENAYPIVTFTWIVCRKKYDNPKIGATVKNVLSYCLETGTGGRGQELSKDLGYIHLPDEALKDARKVVDEIQ